MHYPAIHLFALYRGLRLARGAISRTPSASAASIVTLPLFPAMPEADVERVCATLRDILRCRRATHAASLSAPEVSVVIPVYNEEAGLPALFARLYPRSTRSASPLRDRVRQRRQPRPLGGAAARAVPEAPRRDARRSCSTATSASTWRSWPASSTAAARSSSRSTPTCRTRPRRSRKLLAKMERGLRLRRRDPPQARRTAWFRRCASRAMNSAARAHHPHPA